MKKIKALLMNLLFDVTGKFRTAMAEGEGEPTPTVADPKEPDKKTTVNFEDLIANARKEEKDKLYPEIEKQKNLVKEKVERINGLLVAIGEKDEEIKGLKAQITKLEKGTTSKEDSEEMKALKLKVTELENKLTEKETEMTTFKLSTFKEMKMAEAGGAIIPELVHGNSEEEILASIETAKQRYAEIIGSAQGAVIVQPKKDSTQITPANPNVDKFKEGLSAMNINQLDLFDPEQRKLYEEYRKNFKL